MQLGPQVAALERDFPAALAAFEATDPFTGPARHFHLRAISLRLAHASVGTALADEALLDAIYATLTAWGMHRLGTTGPKLSEFERFAASLQAAAPALTALEDTRLTDGSPTALPTLIDELWAVLVNLRVTPRQSQLVAGTKALHHLLPDLVPPIDREYTLNFALGRKGIRRDGEQEFRATYPVLAHIARACRPQIAAVVGNGFHTSIAKTVDNAVVGYVLGDRGGA